VLPLFDKTDKSAEVALKVQSRKKAVKKI